MKISFDRTVVATICAIIAVLMVLMGIQGWGWFLFAAVVLGAGS